MFQKKNLEEREKDPPKECLLKKKALMMDAIHVSGRFKRR
jgi:hypothetical protein